MPAALFVTADVQGSNSGAKGKLPAFFGAGVPPDQAARRRSYGVAQLRYLRIQPASRLERSQYGSSQNTPRRMGNACRTGTRPRTSRASESGSGGPSPRYW